MLLAMQIEWVAGFDKGVEAAKASKRPLLVYFHGKDSALCKKLESGALSDVAVRREAAGFVCVKLNFGTDGRALHESLGLNGVPQTVLFDGEGHPYWAVQGYWEAREFLEKLRAGAAAAPKMAAFRDVLRREPGNDANLAAFAAFARECGLPGAALGLDERRIENLESAPRSAAESRALAELYVRAATAFLERREPSRVVEYLDALEALDRTNSYGLADDAVMVRAKSLAECRRLDEAAKVLEGGLGRYAPFDGADAGWYTLGSWKVKLKDREGARAAFETLIAGYPGSRYRKSAEGILRSLE